MCNKEKKESDCGLHFSFSCQSKFDLDCNSLSDYMCLSFFIAFLLFGTDSNIPAAPAQGSLEEESSCGDSHETQVNLPVFEIPMLDNFEPDDTIVVCLSHASNTDAGMTMQRSLDKKDNRLIPICSIGIVIKS